MNKFFTKLIILSLIILSSQAFALDTAFTSTSIDKDVVVNDEKSDIDEHTKTLLEKIGFNKFSQDNSTAEISRFFDKHTKCMEKGDFEKLSSLYSENFVNNDGLNKKTYFDLLKLVQELYTNVKVDITPEKMIRTGDYAYAKIYEKSTAETKNSFKNIEGTGSITSEATYLYHLKKDSGKWQIISVDTIAENTSLKFGEAKELEFSLSAPTQIAQDTKYTVSLQTTLPQNALLVASLTNDMIVYPQRQTSEVFRTIKKSGQLERIITSNSEDLNEYAVASIGVTKAGVVNGEKLNLFLTGMAFIMTRVNVEKVNPNHKVEQIQQKDVNAIPEE